MAASESKAAGESNAASEMSTRTSRAFQGHHHRALMHAGGGCDARAWGTHKALDRHEEQRIGSGSWLRLLRARRGHRETGALQHLPARQHLQHLACTDVLDPLHQPLLRVPALLHLHTTHHLIVQARNLARILTRAARAQAQIPRCLNESALQIQGALHMQGLCP